MQYGGTKPEVAKKMQAFLAEKKAGKGAGISAAIILDGELIATCVDGVRGNDLTPASVDDLYNVGSISKVYCAVAIMKLVEMGKVDLDEPVVKYLPKFKMRDERYKDITVRMLLCHTSGMPGTKWHNAIGERWTGENIMEECLSFWETAKLKAAPGEFSVYCNDGFDLAAFVVEEVSGKKFIDFLRDEITTPAGALTTGEADVAIGDRRMMCELGKKPEWLTCVGAGAVRTLISDCARFGYLFIEPQGIIGKEYLAETGKHHGVTLFNEKEDTVSAGYGLGWDVVEFKSPFVDLGENVLAKGGGTAQFLSYLIVSPKYKLSAAISGNLDTGTYTPTLLCQLIAVAMKELGIDVTPKPAAKPEYEVKPIPEGWYEKYSGIYYSFYGAFKPEIQDGKLNLLRYEGDGKWATPPILPPMQWSGERFFSEVNFAIFKSIGSTDYILSKVREDEPFAQKNSSSPEMSSGWKARLGKKYLACNIAPADGVSPTMLGVTIEKAADDGVMLFKFATNPNPQVRPGALGGYKATPAVSAGDDDTDMFLKLPGYGSRDIFAPYITRKDGAEHLHMNGFEFVDVDSLPELKTGAVISKEAKQDAVFRIKAGSKLAFNKPDDVAVFIYDENLSFTYSSLKTAEMPSTCEGYIIFASDGPMDFKIEVQN